MKTFVVYEEELNMLTIFSNVKIICFSLGTWCFTGVIDKYDLPIIFAGVLCYVIGMLLWLNEKYIIKQIRKKSK
jgi:hypothetical protein